MARIIRAGWPSFRAVVVVCVTLAILALSPVHAGRSPDTTALAITVGLPYADIIGGSAAHSPQNICLNHVNCTALGIFLDAVGIGGFISVRIPIPRIHLAHGLRPAPDNPPPNQR